MANDPIDPAERLKRLRAEGNLALKGLVLRTAVLASPRWVEEPRRRRQGQASAPNTLPPERVERSSDEVAAILDDERRVRALAKEIKRLITEDRRRGLGVGG